MNKLHYLPNFITSLRIVGALCLIFTVPFSTAFFILFTFTGITDALDGFIARKTGTTSELGSKLDSAADILFYSIMVLKIIPKVVGIVWVPIWYAVGVAVAVRLASYIAAFVRFKCFSSLHTYLSKATSITIFALPYFYVTPYFNIVCIVLCTLAFFASLEALISNLTRKTYKSDLKTIFEKE